ncbi:MAG: cyclase family protein, partial [Oscillochloris sp.]|nr:cyclase family protein [Oscillochloris sp.]
MSLRVGVIGRACVMLCLLGALILLLAGCTGQDQPSAHPAFTRTVDLSHVIREDVPYLPGEPSTRIERDVYGDVRLLQVGTHTGTTLQVVAAADSALRTIDLLSPHDLVLPTVVIDVRDQAQDNAAYQFRPADLEAWERRYGRVPSGALVLLVTGWDLRWGDATAYLDAGGPGFSATAAATLLDERGASGLGIDAPAGAYTPQSGFR